MALEIHPTTIVEKGAEIDNDVFIGPFCTISAGARIGKGTRLQSHVVIDGLTQIGENNLFYPFCVIGAPPQDLSYANEPTRVLIGDRNVFRESCTIHRGTEKDRKVTTLGNDNYIMAFCHFAHDNLIGNNLIMANQTSLAGHVQVGNNAVIGGQVGITQHVRIGDYAFISAGTVLRKDLPPYLSAKEFSEVSGPNLVGMKRKGVSEENVRVACEIYKIMYLGNLTTEKALLQIEERYPNSDFCKKFTDFVRSSKVGIQR